MNLDNLLVVSKEELENYHYKLRRNNKITMFWIKTFRKMSKELQKECRKKRTNLEELKTHKFKMKNVKIYRFKTEESSKELNEYLQSNYVIVEDIPSEKHKEWIEKVREYINQQKNK